MVSTVATAAVPGSAVAGPALLFEASSGKVLYAEDQDHLWHPASLTKVMTAYVVFDALKAGRISLEQKMLVSEKAHVQAPSKVGLPVGAEMTVDLGVRALIVKSANDVAMMLAETVAGSEEAFVQLMNDTARRIGMTRTRFVNPNGLPAPEQVTTARDLARLGRAVLRDFPDKAHLWALPEVQIGKNRLRSHNALLRTFEGADGLKTGFICDSGFNVIASATRDGRKLMAVVLGDVSGRERNIRAASLLDHGFQTWGWKQIFNTRTVESLPVDPESKDIQSVRQTIISWDCGNRPKAAARKRVPATAAAKQKAKAAKAAAKPAAAAASGTAPAAKSAKAAPAAPPAAKSRE
jgi:D-alanyl-D-alanine carboxypeptidase